MQYPKIHEGDKKDMGERKAHVPQRSRKYPFIRSGFQAEPDYDEADDVQEDEEQDALTVEEDEDVEVDPQALCVEVYNCDLEDIEED